MTDLERIVEIEKIIGFKLDRVEPEEFEFGSVSCVRRYCVDEHGNVTMLSFHKVPIEHLPVDLLRGFQNIRFLDLYSGRMFGYNFFRAYKELSGLNLSETKLQNYSFLAKQKDLTSLALSSNQISDISILKELKNLTSLDLSSNQISDISILSELKNLTSLDLSSNQINDISILKELKNLTSLDLSSNQINDFSILKDLKNLISLYLSNNEISDISSLKELKKLTGLVLNDNQINDISSLKELQNLTSLHLSKNQIRDISSIKELKNLTILNLRGNQISDINSLKELKNLTYLVLSGNQIRDINCLKVLQTLAMLNLSHNRIIKIPEWLIERGLEISIGISGPRYADFFGNPIQTPPIEIVKQGNEAIRQWFAANKKKLNEIKVLLVGEAKAGKTSLMRRLFNNEYNPNEQQTDGITIETFTFAKLKTFKKQKTLHGITAYFWDFGGQEIMSSTHQFFMTKRSLYILVLEARKDEKSDEQVRDWMRRIRAFGGDSQVITVINKIDQNPAFRLDEYTLQKEFPQIKEIIRVSCAAPENCDTVKAAIEKYIPKTELFNTEIDERWFPVKEELQKRTSQNSYLSQREFESICRTHGLLEQAEQLSAVRFLNDLGMVLHFDNLTLSEFYVLDPFWVTSGVYRIITSEAAAKQNGVIDVEQLSTIVNSYKDAGNKYSAVSDRHIKYSPNEVRYIADIMAEFKLCYYMDNGKKILIPDLLDKNTPASECEPFYNASDKLSMVYNYEYLPTFVLPRFIVEMRNDVTNTVWRTGVVLHCKGCFNAKALVYTLENRLHIMVTGEHKQKREYLSVIRYLIDSINKDFTVTTSVHIPLPGNEKYTVKYDNLLKMEKAGEQVYKNWDIEKEFSINQLLDGIAPVEEVMKAGLTQRVPSEQMSKAPRTVTIFLASSNELEEHRKQFEIFINRQNKNYMEKENIFLKLELWEDFIDAMDQVRLQNAYNRTIKECDIFVMLYWSKVGMYTAEEFGVAYEQFKNNDRKKIYTYEHSADIPKEKMNRKDTISLFDFKEMLHGLGHFPTQYTNIDNLEYQFGEQLKKIIPEIVAS